MGSPCNLPRYTAWPATIMTFFRSSPFEGNEDGPSTDFIINPFSVQQTPSLRQKPRRSVNSIRRLPAVAFAPPPYAPAALMDCPKSGELKLPTGAARFV